MKEPLEHKRVLTGGANQVIIKYVRRLAKRGSESAMCGLQAPVEREAARPAHDIGKRKPPKAHTAEEVGRFSLISPGPQPTSIADFLKIIFITFTYMFGCVSCLNLCMGTCPRKCVEVR